MGNFFFENFLNNRELRYEIFFLITPQIFIPKKNVHYLLWAMCVLLWELPPHVHKYTRRTSQGDY